MKKPTKSKPSKSAVTDSNPHFYADVLARSLLRINVPKYEAYAIAHKIWEKMSHQKKDRKIIMGYVEESLKKKFPQLLNKYHSWQGIMAQPKPIIIVLGGGTGIGTSTLAMRLAWLLEISHIISTDAVREVTRQFIPKDVMPVLHTSTYRTGELVTEVKSKHDRLMEGFIMHSKPVLNGVEAIIKRSINEKCSMIVEGVHLIPGQMDFLDKYKDDAIIIQIMLDVNQEAKHRLHITSRNAENAKRSENKYLKYFKEIRLIRDFLVEQAAKNHVTVVQNYDFKKAEKEILEKIFLSYAHKKN